ncbi:uncharacterized protein I303_106433 [Kwoniella dejecticola CBS 10117]|uniref:Uncharacterized protein n=1 Tax=Kwoniella dejecticola CBS 10117 TaxID=1296121 RepID=A0A1A5ZUR0_9TREE|nr:uncharacterized protein I303_08308 [Kwoniella dejecticola CBS 10117]OBR81538.1 hypothetical protein I303_08308 [Kwoniella dejecticola CBS 10117]
MSSSDLISFDPNSTSTSTSTLDTQANPGPSTSKRMQASRSHSAPSLTHWVGTPDGPIKRSWNPSTSPCIPIISVEGKIGVATIDKGKGKGKGKAKESGIEEELSQLYVTHERQEAEAEAQAQAQASSSKSAHTRRSPVKNSINLERGTPSKLLGAPSSVIPGTSENGATNANASVISSQTEDLPEGSRGKRRSWGSSLVGSAVSVGVFGAALGLTAYRLISNQPSSSLSPTRPEVQGAISAASEVERDSTISGPTDAAPVQGQSQRSDAIEENSLPRIATTGEEAAGRCRSTTNRQQPPTSSPMSHDRAQGGQIPVQEVPISRDDDTRRRIADLQPPPTYEETERLREGRAHVASSVNPNPKEWEDLVDIDIGAEERHDTVPLSRVSPLIPRTIKGRPSTYSLLCRYSPSPKSKSNARRNNRIRRSRSSRKGMLFGHSHSQSISLSSTSSMPSIEIYHDGSDLFTANLEHSGLKTQQGYEPQQDGVGQAEDVNRVNQEGEKEEDKHEDEMISRLDSMSSRLASLIEEGRKALESTPGLGTTPGWEDEVSLYGASQEREQDHEQDQKPSQVEDGIESAQIITSIEHGTDTLAQKDHGKKRRRYSKIPTRVGSDLHLKQSSSKDRVSSEQAAECHDESEKQINQRSKIPIRSKGKIDGLNAV